MNKAIVTKRARKAPSRVEMEIGRRLQGFVDELKSSDTLPDKLTLRSVSVNVESKTCKPADVVAVRKLLGTSQNVFGFFLGVSTKTVRAWEQGTNKPSGIACRFLDEIRRNPDYWRQRLRESIEVKKPA